MISKLLRNDWRETRRFPWPTIASRHASESKGQCNDEDGLRLNVLSAKQRVKKTPASGCPFFFTFPGVATQFARLSKGSSFGAREIEGFRRPAGVPGEDDGTQPGRRVCTTGSGRSLSICSHASEMDERETRAK